MVTYWIVIFLIGLTIVSSQNRVLDPLSAMKDDISRIKVTMESVEENLEKFNSLYINKLENRVVAVANSLGHIDSNIKNLQERAHVWDTFQLHVSAWNEQIKAVDKKLDLLNRGYDKWEAMSDKVSQLPGTEVTLNKILNRLDEVDRKFIDIQRRLNSTNRSEVPPLLPEFASRGVLSTLKEIEVKVTRVVDSNKQCGHVSDGNMMREILTVVNDMAGKVDFLVDKVPVKRNARDEYMDVDSLDEDYPEQGSYDEDLKKNPEKEFIKVWRKMVHPFRKANKKFETMDRLLIEMEKFVNASNIVTRDSPLLSEIQNDVIQINQCCKNNDFYLKNGIKTLETALDSVGASVNELLRGNEKCNSYYKEQIQQQTYEIQNAVRSLLTGKEAETKEVDVFLERVGREESFPNSEYIPTTPPVSPQPTSCEELRTNGESQSKTYRVSTMELNDRGRDYNLRFCDMATEGGGWTIIQRRGYFGEPMQNFSLSWQDYRFGFGDLNKEFWFGNDYIHRLTNEFDMILRIDLWDFEGNRVYAEYETFKVDSEEDQYRIWVGGYKGNATDSFSTHSGYAFSTWDRDNDEAPPCCPCAPAYGGGWWFYRLDLSKYETE
ncbi:angiopoietin-related protein 3-like [Artemia franciscana]|uniref:angiopoietin-related protein 3-like n=1 Tax=Artemia franciscana TaxID=6661 RepID=UPI0032DA212F